MWAGRHVVLGVSGGIACYKSCYLARRLIEAGAVVDVVLTQSAAEFVRPVTFEALTGRPVLTSLWEPGGALAHLRLGRAPDLVIVAPATANLLARVAQGLADDLLTTLLLARTAPVLVAPAMNDEMYANPLTQRNLAILKDRGLRLRGPGGGRARRGTVRASRPDERAGDDPGARGPAAARRRPARRAAGRRHRGADARVDRSGAGGDQPLERPDGLPAGGGGLGAGRRRRSHLGSGGAPAARGRHGAAGGDDEGAGRRGARGPAGGGRAADGGGPGRLPAGAPEPEQAAAHRGRARRRRWSPPTTSWAPPRSGGNRAA